MCNFDKGVSMERGAFRFQKGEWNKIYMNVTLNNPANATNGLLEIRHNGKRVIYFDKMNYRQLSDYKLEAVEFRCVLLCAVVCCCVLLCAVVCSRVS